MAKGIRSFGGIPSTRERYEKERHAVLAKYARNGKPTVPLATDQSNVYWEGTPGVALESDWAAAARR